MSRNLPLMNKDEESLSRDLDILDSGSIFSNTVKSGKQSLPSYCVDKQNNESKYAELRDKDSYLNKSYEDIENFMFNPDLVKEYERIKHSYKGLINMFEDSLLKSMYLNEEPDGFKGFNFESLEDFDNAVSKGDVNISDYSMKEINSLMQDLEHLEDSVDNRSLYDYSLETISDFHHAVDNGILNLNKHSIKDITTLIAGLKDDEKLKLSDYNISLFGNVAIDEIHIKVGGDIYGKEDYSNLSKPSSEDEGDNVGIETKVDEESLKAKVDANSFKTESYEELLGKETLETENKEAEHSCDKSSVVKGDISILSKILNFLKGIFNRKKDQ